MVKTHLPIIDIDPKDVRIIRMEDKMEAVKGWFKQMPFSKIALVIVLFLLVFGGTGFIRDIIPWGPGHKTQTSSNTDESETIRILKEEIAELKRNSPAKKPSLSTLSTDQLESIQDEGRKVRERQVGIDPNGPPVDPQAGNPPRGYNEYPNPEQGMGGRGEPQCSLPNSVFVPQVGGCVQHVTDRSEIAQVMPPEQKHDRNCEGKPAGFRYDKAVTAPDGRRGTAHIVCGARPH